MIDTTWERWATTEAALMAAGDNPFAQIDAMVAACRLRVSFDPGSSYALPCTICGTTERPRELVRIGTYPDGSGLHRPVCDRHRLMTHLRGAKAVAERTSWRPRRLRAGWSRASS